MSLYLFLITRSFQVFIFNKFGNLNCIGSTLILKLICLSLVLFIKVLLISYFFRFTNIVVGSENQRYTISRQHLMIKIETTPC